MRSSEVIIENLAGMAKEAAFGSQAIKKGKAVKDAVVKGYKEYASARDMIGGIRKRYTSAKNAVIGGFRDYPSALRGKGVARVKEKLRVLDIKREHGLNPEKYTERLGELTKALRGEKTKTVAARTGTGLAGAAGLYGAGDSINKHKSKRIKQ